MEVAACGKGGDCAAHGVRDGVLGCITSADRLPQLVVADSAVCRGSASSSTAVCGHTGAEADGIPGEHCAAAGGASAVSMIAHSAPAK